MIALIPLPPDLLKAANDRAIANGYLTFGHGIVTALILLVLIGVAFILKRILKTLF